MKKGQLHGGLKIWMLFASGENNIYEWAEHIQGYGAWCGSEKGQIHQIAIVVACFRAYLNTNFRSYNELWMLVQE